MSQKIYRKVYELFSKKEGSKHIASLYALSEIERIVSQKKIDVNILEFGTGIGTIPYLLNEIALTKRKDINYVGIEKNQYCLDLIEINVDPSNFLIFKIISNINTIKFYQPNFVIVDGSFENIDFLKNIISNDALIFVEGDRRQQVELVSSLFSESISSFNISMKKNPVFSPFPYESYVGGFTKIYLNPSFIDYINCFKERARTALFYRIRKLLS